MAKLSTKQRNALPDSDFAGPGRSFPDQDANHARAALSMAGKKSPAVAAKVRAKVHKDWPGIGGGKKKAVYSRLSK